MQGKIVMQPWKGWADEPYTTKNGITRYRLAHKKTNPEWWLAYNSTKHRRKSLIHPSESSYQRANLGNTLSALAGLHVLEKLFLAQIGPSENQLVETSELFEFI